ncbi:MAG: hypothetical protein NTW56_03570 [Alphaproteobacteria bacterium]|nr:hypothetical protein [Alphaproteobacteria bacterium]
MPFAPLIAATVIVALLPFLFLGGAPAPGPETPRATEAPRMAEAPRPMAVVAGLEGRLNTLATRVDGQDARIAEATAALRQALAEANAALREAQAQARTATEAQAALATRLEARIAEAARAAAEANQRIAATEARAARLAAVAALRDAMGNGAPRGEWLPRLASVPPALARFATTAPPTEAALRQAFEDTARAARAGGRSLFTIRRGEEVLVGDAAEAEIERARRLLAGGDVAGAVQHTTRVPGIAPWLEAAQPLLAARAALAALGGA